MARIVSLLTLTSLAVLLASFQASPVDALSVNSHNARSSHHNVLAKRVNGGKAKRCKPRSPPAAVTTSSKAPAKSAPAKAIVYGDPKKDPKGDNKDGNKGDNKGGDNKDGPTSTKEPSKEPAKTTTKEPASTANAPSGGVYGLFPGKKLLAWGDEFSKLKQWNGLAQRGYNWQPTTNSQTSQFGVNWCPMMWGWNQVDSFRKNVVDSNTPVDCALGMNEPELGSQSNMDPGSAANLWVDHFIPLKNKKGTLLGTPAVTSDVDNAQRWLDSFFAGCADRTGDKRCKADFQALHYYDTSVSGFKKFLTDMHNRYGLPIVVTEFGDHSFIGGRQPSQDEVFSFAGQMKDFFQNTDWIAGYAPFGAMIDLPDITPANKIMKGDHNPNDLAYVYYN